MCIKSVIFDLDGVIIDSEYLIFKAWQRYLIRQGYMLDDDDFRAMYGLDAAQTVSYLCDKLNLASAPATLLEQNESLMLSVLSDNLEPLPGVLNLIAHLSEHEYPLAIASNSSTYYVKQVLNNLGISGAFSVVIGRDLVATGKPAPDVYLAVAKQLNILPAQCLVIEDSPVGGEAAVTSGARCILVRPLDENNEAVGGVFAEYSSMPELIADLERLMR